MKRYLLSILLGILVVGGIGIYLFYGTVDHLPNYKLTTVQGNPAEGADIELTGEYYGRWKTESVGVDVKGSDYASRNINFRHRFQNYRGRFFEKAELLQQLIKDHRQFMRGKSNLDGFYTDDNWIIYAESSLVEKDPPSSKKTTFDIHILDKSTNITRRFATSSLLNEEYSNVTITDVQLIGEQIHLLTSQYSTTFSSNKSHDYVVDSTNGELLSSNELAPITNKDENLITSISSVNTARSFAPSDFIVLIVNEEKIISRISEDSYLSEETARHYYSYSYKTGKLEALPDSFVQVNKNESVSYGLYDGYFTYVTFNSESLVLSRFNLNTRKEEKAYVSVTAQQMGATVIKTARVESNKVYAILQNDDIPMAAVLDLANGELLYAGEVTNDGPVSELDKGMKQVRLNNLYIKKNE